MLGKNGLGYIIRSGKNDPITARSSSSRARNARSDQGEVRHQSCSFASFTILKTPMNKVWSASADLRPETLREAYRHGIFPWFDESLPILWWSPDPRAVIEIGGLHISRRLARTIRQGKFEVSVDLAFREVMEGCADRPGLGAWITGI